MMSANKSMKVLNNSSLSEVPSVSISDLPNDLLKHCFSFIPGSYVTVAPVSRQFFSNYCTLGMDDSTAVSSADSLLKIRKNRRTTADAVSNDVHLTEYCLINEAPEAFMIKVCQKAALKGRKDIIECAHMLGIDVKKMMGFFYLFKPYEEQTHLIIKLAKEGNLEMLKYFDNRFPETVTDSDLQYCLDMFQMLRDRKSLHVMKWIVEEKQKKQDPRSVQILERSQAYDIDVTIAEPSSIVFAIASIQGNLEVLERCHRNNVQCGSWALKLAIKNKDKERALETLKWLRRHDCPWDEESSHFFCKEAAYHDNLEALRWGRSEGCPWDEGTLYHAVKNGNIDMLKYCLQNGCPMTFFAFTSVAMSNKDHHTALEVLKILRKYSCPWGEMTCISAAIGSDNYEAMFWAKRNGCPWTERDFCDLVRRGHVSAIEEALQDEPHNVINDLYHVNEIFRAALTSQALNASCIIEKLKLLCRYGYKWNVNTSAMVVELGQLQVLRWIRYMGYPMDANTCTAAVKYGNIDILKYAYEVAGCELSKEAFAYCFDEYGLYRDRSCIPTAVRNSHVDLLKYLEKNDCPKPKMSEWTMFKF